MKWIPRAVFVLFLAAGTGPSSAAAEMKAVVRGDAILSNYFRVETEALANRPLTDVRTLEQWQNQRESLRQQLFEMLSLAPLPPRTDLKPVITGKVEQEDFTVENLQFQSMPGLYVTGNLYLPKGQQEPAPAILYVCGHALVITNGISYGNKTAYQHHGIWLARNGYVCLTIDTVQLGEIQGVHHGTYREGMWWWNSRGYTPAGVEAWNSIRALDYLQSRPEVDGSRLGVTGRSGGGAYSWWVTALDDRIKAAAPVAGITDLRNHVVDGVVEGHCDCMFIVNTYRWDYPTVAALAAPRPLLICNSDKDSIFPLDGVVRVHSKVASIYKLYGATNNLGLLITEGPHKDTQDLQLPVFRWFNRHLKGEDPVIQMAATRQFGPDQLKVFEQLPPDERTSQIHETFVAATPAPEPPKSASEWAAQRDAWKIALHEKVFRGWPAEPPPVKPVALAQDGTGQTLTVYEFVADHDIPLRLYVSTTSRPASRIRMSVQDAKSWTDWIKARSAQFPDLLHDEAAALEVEPTLEASPMPPHLVGSAEVYFAPRGIGLSAWSANDRQQNHIRRRFMLLGQTLDGMRVWDIRRAIQAVRSMPEFRDLPISLESSGAMAVNTLYASLFEPKIEWLILSDLPASHRQGPDYLNILRFLDIPQAVAMAVEATRVHLRNSAPGAWSYPTAVVSNLKWPANQFAP